MTNEELKALLEGALALTVADPKGADDYTRGVHHGIRTVYETVLGWLAESNYSSEQKVMATCNFCGRTGGYVLVHGHTNQYCQCGSNNLTIDGVFVGPVATF